MGLYKVPFSKLVTTTVTVRASTEKEAILKAALELPPSVKDCPIEIEYGWEGCTDVEEVK